MVLTLVMTLTIGTVLASYLGLLGSRYKVTLRSQCWNAAIPVLEAGIEEALTHLQDDPNDLAANGWPVGAIAGQQVYSKQRSFADGSYFLANIYNATTFATNTTYIYSTGFIPSPLSADNYISRTVRVTVGLDPLLKLAFSTVYTIQMNGSGLASDSFNSSNPALSTNGQYDPTKTSTNGNVASVYGPVNFGNHSINGNLYLGPWATSVVTAGQVSGKIYSDFNVSLPDVVLPAATWLPAATTTVNGNPTHHFTASGDYYVADSSDVVVEPGVTVRLRVDTTTFSPANVHIASTNGTSGKLTVYQVSGSATLSGNTTVDSGQASNFYYYGLPGVTSITYGGTTAFIGVIYAPEADLTLNGGGNNVDIIGSVVSKSLTMNGHYNFHFDEALLSTGPNRGLIATDWMEL